MLTHRSTFAADPVELAELICSEAFCLESQRAREDVVDARFESLPDEGGVRRFTMHTTHYARQKTGRLDTSRTEQSRTEYRFDPCAGVVTWRHIDDRGDTVDVRGTTRFSAGGAGAVVDRKVSIAIRIPIVGRAITKLVESRFKEGFAQMEAQVKRHLQGG